MSSKDWEAPSGGPAGWYEHPEDPGSLRYFDGEAWTDFTHPKDGPTNEHVPPATASRPAWSQGPWKPSPKLLVGVAVALILAWVAVWWFWPKDEDVQSEPLPQSEVEEPEEPKDPEPTDETEEEPKPEEPLPPSPAETVYLTDEAEALNYGGVADFDWLGGMAGAARIDGSNVVVAGWMPGMSGLNVCRLRPLNGPEDFASGTASGKSVELIAPLENEDFTAYLLFSAATPAEGLEPEKTVTYVLPFDMETCTAEDRIDVTGPIHKDLNAFHPKFGGASTSTIAVAPYPNNNRKHPDVPVLFGFDTKTQSVVWELSTPGTTLKLFGGGSADEKRCPYVLDIKVGDEDVRKLLLVEDGSTVVESPLFDAPLLSMGPDNFLYTTRTHSFGGESSQSIYHVNEVASTPVERSLGSNAQAGRGPDGSIVAAGYLCGNLETKCDANNGAALGHMDTEGRTKELLSSAQVEALGVQFLGFAGGRVYVKTTSETIALDLDGNQVGGRIDVETRPYVPVQSLILPSETWTLWEIPKGRANYVVTKDGEMPAVSVE